MSGTGLAPATRQVTWQVGPVFLEPMAEATPELTFLQALTSARSCLAITLGWSVAARVGGVQQAGAGAEGGEPGCWGVLGGKRRC